MTKFRGYVTIGGFINVEADDVETAYERASELNPRQILDIIDHVEIIDIFGDEYPEPI